MRRPHQIALTLPQQMREALDQIARETGRRRSELIREYIQRGIEENQRWPRP